MTTEISFFPRMFSENSAIRCLYDLLHIFLLGGSKKRNRRTASDAAPEPYGSKYIDNAPAGKAAHISGRKSGQSSDTKNRLKHSCPSVFNAEPTLYSRDDKESLARIGMRCRTDYFCVYYNCHAYSLQEKNLLCPSFCGLLLNQSRIFCECRRKCVLPQNGEKCRTARLSSALVSSHFRGGFVSWKSCTYTFLYDEKCSDGGRGDFFRENVRKPLQIPKKCDIIPLALRPDANRVRG